MGFPTEVTGTKVEAAAALESKNAELEAEVKRLQSEVPSPRAEFGRAKLPWGVAAPSTVAPFQTARYTGTATVPLLFTGTATRGSQNSTMSDRRRIGDPRR